MTFIKSVATLLLVLGSFSCQLLNGFAQPPGIENDLAGAVLSREMNRMFLENKTAYLYQPVTAASISRETDGSSSVIGWDYNSF